MLPEVFQSISVSNTEPFNLSSFALSLLLVSLTKLVLTLTTPRNIVAALCLWFRTFKQPPRIDVVDTSQVFRTNSSYARWEEARRIWGSIVNRSRDLVRQVGVRRQRRLGIQLAHRPCCARWCGTAAGAADQATSCAR